MSCLPFSRARSAYQFGQAFEPGISDNPSGLSTNIAQLSVNCKSGLTASGDPGAGISETVIEIKGALFDLGTMAENDHESFIEDYRADLEKAFGRILDEAVTVLFDFEEE